MKDDEEASAVRRRCGGGGIKEPDPIKEDDEVEAEKGLGRSSTPDARRSGHGIILGREGVDGRVPEADRGGPKGKGSPDVDNAKSAGCRRDAARCANDSCAGAV